MMAEIEHKQAKTSLLKIVTHAETIYLAGPVGAGEANVKQQTRECLGPRSDFLRMYDWANRISCWRSAGWQLCPKSAK